MRMQQAKGVDGPAVIHAWADPTGTTVNYMFGYQWPAHLGGPVYYPVETYPRDGLSLEDAMRRDWAEPGAITVLCGG